MPQILRPQSTKVITKNGECLVSISLELTINLNSDGVKLSVKESESDEQGMPIQDFASKKKIKFGKTIEE
jgi:hypothetical protein